MLSDSLVAKAPMQTKIFLTDVIFQGPRHHHQVLEGKNQSLILHYTNAKGINSYMLQLDCISKDFY